jgi:hypothetical protein
MDFVDRYRNPVKRQRAYPDSLSGICPWKMGNPDLLVLCHKGRRRILGTKKAPVSEVISEKEAFRFRQLKFMPSFIFLLVWPPDGSAPIKISTAILQSFFHKIAIFFSA